MEGAFDISHLVSHFLFGFYLDGGVLVAFFENTINRYLTGRFRLGFLRIDDASSSDFLKEAPVFALALLHGLLHVPRFPSLRLCLSRALQSTVHRSIGERIFQFREHALPLGIVDGHSALHPIWRPPFQVILGKVDRAV